jgi:hypothetical protein
MGDPMAEISEANPGEIEALFVQTASGRERRRL